MLSDNIKNLRKQKGYTQETLAQSLNIVRQTVSKWEKGYSVPDADMLEKLSDVLEVPVSDLLGKPSEAPEQVSELERISSQLAIINEQMAREMARRKRNRKIMIIVASVILGLIIIFVAFVLISHPVGSIMSGDASHVEIKEVSSDLYSQDEIESAIEVIKRDFENDWNGCSLKTIYYAGDEVCADETHERGVKTIVLVSDFSTGKLDGNGGLNSNYTYENWNWILIKNEDGSWKHIDHGYC